MRVAAALLFVLTVPTFAYAALVNINTADAALLDTLPGVGPSKAAAIIEYRTQHGPFAAPADIQKVSGIGPVTYANLEMLITVGTTSAPAQPPPASASYKKVQTVDTITSAPSNIQTHDEGTLAPAAPAEPTAAGAPLPSPGTGIFHSPWTLGLFGVIVLAGGVFIFI